MMMAASGAGRADDAAQAQTLFNEARKLMAAGRVSEACEKFERSQQLGPAPGTLLNLAVCHERQGKLASAWEEFQQTRAEAQRTGRKDRIKVAGEHLKSIEPRLPWLTIAVPEPSRVGALELSLDGTLFGQEQWDKASAVNPGEHVVTAQARGRKPFSKTLQIAEAERVEVRIPLLEDATPPAVSASAPRPVAVAPPPPRSGSGTKTAGYVTGAVGVIGLGVGAAFGLMAMKQWQDSEAGCPHEVCSATGSQASHDAARSATIADIGFGVGVVGLAVGAVLLLTAGDSSTSSTQLRAYGSPRGMGATLSW